MHSTSPWLSVKDAAQYLGMNEYTLRELMRCGDIEARKPNGRWRTKQEWLNNYMNGAA